MLVVLELDEDDVEAVVEALNTLPRRPSHISVQTEHTWEAHSIRRTLRWLPVRRRWHRKRDAG